MMRTEMTELREWFWTWLASRPDLTAAHVAAHTSLSRSGAESYLSRSEPDRTIGEKTHDEFLRLRNLIETGEVLRPNTAALSVEADRELETPALPERRQRDYYKTSASKRIAQVLGYCWEQAAIGVVSADYGVGKTTAVQHWRAGKGLRIPNCYFEFDEFSRSSIADFITRLAETVGIDDYYVHRNSDAMRCIVRHLSAHPMLLIFDQCETVVPRVLSLIRQIWDGSRHSGTGMVLLASPLLANRLHSPRLKEEIGALTSRVGVWAAIEGVGRAEAAGIIRMEGITDIDDAAIDLLLRMSRGSMRRLMAVTDMLVARHAGKRVTSRVIEGVAENLWGMQVDPRRRAV